MLILQCAFAETVLLWVVAFTAIQFISIALRTESWLIGHLSPHALFVDQLLDALVVASASDKNWLDPTTRSILMMRLEQAARTIDKDIPNATRPFDPYTASWQRERFGRIANALRVKKQQICVPTPDTRESLRKSLAAFLVDASCGYWNNLESCEPVTVKQSLVPKVRQMIQSLMIAATPLAAVVVANRFFNLSLRPEEQYMLIAAIVWAIINVLLILDPRVSEKLEAVQRVASIFLPGLSDRKKD
jgi:hypothetical protein